MIFLLAAILIKNIKGNRLAIYNGYAFNVNGISGRGAKSTSWKCTQYGTKCRSHFLATADGVILRESIDHPHAAPKFVIRNGIYIKV